MSENKKKEIYEVMKKYVNEHNCIDITKFRKEHPNEYALLSHHFGGVNEAVESFGWVKVTKTAGKNGDKITLRNRLAYDLLDSLRNEQHKTLEDIATKYGVTRSAINQLYKALKSSMEESSEVESKNKNNAK